MNSQYSSVYTLTTPTITPTTLKNIEQTILNLNEQAQNNGSFVPPLPNNNNNIILTNTWQGGEIMQDEDSNFVTTIVPTPVVKKRGGKRNAGGRKPNNNRQCTPEEDERRQVRRERNKLAAARCRKRRVDHTNTLIEETEQLESTKREIQKQITDLQNQRDELEFILQAHNTNCSKIFKKKMIKRPNTLIVQPQQHQQLQQQQQQPQIPNNPGIPLSTPSNGLSFDLDWNDLPSTGLTPTTNNLITPLVTPGTVNSILNSLGGGIKCEQEFVDL